MEKIKISDLNRIDLKGKVIVFPTDTVYGLGCLLNDKVAIQKIYEIKGRDLSKPLAVLTGSMDINKYVKNINDATYDLIKKSWPGALTLIFDKTEEVNDIVTSGLKTVAFRMPDNKIAKTILSYFGPMATTSVNLSGSNPLNNIEDIEKQFAEKIDYLVCDKSKSSNAPSHIYDARGNSLKKIR